MKKYYSISIPKPCHEDWNAMTPKEKGRFCGSCSKTVIDFTKMDTYEIQDFINENKDKRVCGHFRQTQLDSINLHIPSKVLEQQKSFHKIFLLALLIAMGTSLMNCTNKNGNTQKIDSVEVVDSINNDNIINIFEEQLPERNDIDTIPKKNCSLSNNKPVLTKNKAIDEVIILETGEIIVTGDMVVEPPEQDSLDILEPITGLIVPEPPVTDEEDIVLGFIQVETPPQFKNTPNNLSTKEMRDYFSKEISGIVTKNFNTSVCLDLTGKQRVYAQFKIDKKGKIIDIKARAPHPKLEEEAKRVIKLLPQFVPAKQHGKPVTMVYTLPIVFKVEE